ncbi:MAG: hypothetical protein FJ096_03720 [Deltaproteobacteria bacterium]|nr:hypothetical protein [Deltaproteobacteria bacterium]
MGNFETTMIMGALAASLGATSVASAQCKPPKTAYQGRCVYPDEIPVGPAPRAPQPASATKPPPRPKAPPATAEVQPLPPPSGSAVKPEPSNAALPSTAPTPEREPSRVADAPNSRAVEPGRTELDRPEPAPVSPSSPRSPTMAYVGFGLAGLGLVVGTATGIAALAKDKALVCPNNLCPPESEAELKSVMGLAHASTASFVIAGVGATLGVVGLFWGREAASTTVLVGPGSVGLQGRF